MDALRRSRCRNWLRIGATVVLAAALPLTAQSPGTDGAKRRSWAWKPLEPVAVPGAAGGAEASPSAIDAFVADRLKRSGLTLSRPADRRTLIRRLTFDLHGLPPTPAAVEAFVADPRADSYERLVDRLLASPRYGERWARHWLDVAHYGETHGYDKDKLRRHAWPYRDWVIEALNADLPYTRFVTAQIAADTLRPRDPQAIRALGFLAAGPWDFVGHRELREGTVEKKTTRLLDRDDFVTTVMSTFVSTTAHCARCHDHKFDPIPQRDYYRLHAVFAGVDRGNRVFREPPAQRFLTSHARTLGYHSAIEKSPDVPKWVQVDLGETQAIDVILLFPAHEKFGGHPGPGFGFPRRFRIELADEPEFRRPIRIADFTSRDIPNPGDQVQTFFVGGWRGRYVRVTATRLWERTADWIFALGEMAVLRGTQNLAAGQPVTALDSIEAAGAWGRGYLTDGAAFRTGSKVYAVVPAKAVRTIHLLRRGSVTAPREVVAPGALSGIPGLAHHFAGLDVPTQTPDEAARRRALARWITDPDNPLTWRSIVNRVWQHHFGRGLVSTPNDFGHMGDPPTHPALLDWLAQWFRDDGGSLKRLHRLLVCTATYRQASQRDAKDPVLPRAIAQDAQNRLLWRMRRRRLSAEEVRDAVLATSGRLDLTAGGPSVRWFGFKDDHSPHYDYRAFDPDGPGANRRSIYRHIVRSVPDPFMECLDGADASQSTPVRFTTLTALQALTMQNNPFLLRQAEHFAARLKASSDDPSARIDRAWRLLTGRGPTPTESAAVAAYQEKHGWANTCRILFNLNEFLFVD